MKEDGRNMSSFLKQKAMAAFQDYIRRYDTKDGKVVLKIVHTYNVASIAEMLAEKLGWQEEDIQLAWLIGLLHDIGRFEQIRRYGTFMDGKSENHALLSVRELKKDSLLRQFIETDAFDNLILTAVINHNRLHPEEIEDARVMKHVRLLRDADKIDIFRVRAEDPLADICDISEQQMEASFISQPCFETFMRHECIRSQDRRTPADIWLGGIATVYDLNYACAMEETLRQGNIRKMVSRFAFQDQRMEQAAEEAQAWLKRRLNDER